MPSWEWRSIPEKFAVEQIWKGNWLVVKAATLTSPQEIRKRPLRVGEVATPEPKQGQVLLRVRVCGVCRTDLHIVEGDLPPLRPGIIPGHQIVGEVVAGATEEASRRHARRRFLDGRN